MRDRLLCACLFVDELSFLDSTTTGHVCQVQPRSRTSMANATSAGALGRGAVNALDVDTRAATLALDNAQGASDMSTLLCIVCVAGWGGVVCPCRICCAHVHPHFAFPWLSCSTLVIVGLGCRACFGFCCIRDVSVMPPCFIISPVERMSTLRSFVSGVPCASRFICGACGH
jgi:hypothetical protein